MVRSNSESSTDKRRRYQIRLVRKIAAGNNCSGWGKKALGCRETSGGNREERRPAYRSRRSPSAARRQSRGADDANAGGSARPEAPPRAGALRPCGQATKRRAPKGAEGCLERIERRERWWRSGRRRKEETQRPESVKCDPELPGIGPRLGRRKRRREGR